MRSCAATLVKLEGGALCSPKAALRQLVAEWGEPHLTEAVERLSEAREQGRLAPGTAEGLVFDLLELVDRLRARAEKQGGGAHGQSL